MASYNSETLNAIALLNEKNVELMELQAKVYRYRLNEESYNFVTNASLQSKCAGLKGVLTVLETYVQNFEEIRFKLRNPDAGNVVHVPYTQLKYIHAFFNQMVPLCNEWDKFKLVFHWLQGMNINDIENKGNDLVVITEKQADQLKNFINLIVLQRKVLKNLTSPDISKE